MGACVIITDLTTAKKPGRGKVTPSWFFPPFVAELEAAGLAVAFTSSAEWLETRLAAAATEDRVFLIHVFNEEQPLEALARFSGSVPGATGVFNPPEIVDIISEKSVTNRFLAAAGVRVPAMAGKSRADFEVFSNARMASHAPVQTIPAGQALPGDRYNTRMIDTRRPFGGRLYHSGIRLMCVGSTLVAAMVRLRDADDGDPSVHNRDTPVDAALVEHFQQTLVDARLKEWKKLSRRLGRMLPPAFFAHDIIVESGSEKPYVCEVGLKFNDMTFMQHLTPIAKRLPESLRRQFSPRFPRRSARAFLKECAARGWLPAPGHHL